MPPPSMYPTLTPPPPTPNFLRLGFPSPGVLLITMSRERHHNCMSYAGTQELDAVFEWLDEEPTLIVAVITGAGKKAFTTGADLKEWNASYTQSKEGTVRAPVQAVGKMNLASRRGKKPVIAAVNGLAYGGGTEFVVNSDLVVAADTAIFALPEVKRGLVPFAGALPRLIRSVGLQRASELALIGGTMTAQEMFTWGLVNKVVPQDQVVPEALKYAQIIAENSPDAIICTRAGLREGWETASVDWAAEKIRQNQWEQLLRGENVQEGLKAFNERRKPQWKPSKL